jgi:GMP synthase-like glutamine amidotransferase
LNCLFTKEAPEKMRNFLIVQHMDWEGPGGHLLTGLAEAGIAYQVVEAWHEPLPGLESFAGMIVLGGGPNVNEEEEFPYLRPLKGLIRECLASGRAYLGFCLGHQLLAHVLGCEVAPLPQKSVGFITGRLTPRGLAHPAFAGLPEHLDLFKWHGQGVHLPVPHGVTILATSAAAAVEALGLKDNPRVVGLQFDNHADATDAARWLECDRDWALSGTDVDPQQVIARARTLETRIGQEFRLFLRNFFRVSGLI